MSDRHRPAHIPSFLIWGGWYGSRNIGDSAILLGLKALITRVNPGREFYIRALSTDPDYTSTHGVTGVKALVKSEALQPWAWFRVLLTFARPELIVVSGGTPIFDASHAVRTLYLALPVLLHVPVVVFGAGVKPLRSRYGRWSVARLLRHVRFVSVRDEDSREILERLGIPRVELTADSAFFAPPASPEALKGLLDEYGVGQDESLLVVAPRLLSTQRNRLYLEESMTPELIRETPAKLAEAVDRLAPRFGRVVLMAMHYHGPDSDVPIIREVCSLVGAPNVTFLDRELRPELAIALFRRARIVLGVRLHAALLASSMGTPVVGIAYEQKGRSLLARLGLQSYCLDLFDLDVRRIVTTVEAALDQEAELRQHLRDRVSALRALVLDSAERALKLPASSSEEGRAST